MNKMCINDLKTEVIIPLYNAEKQIRSLHASLLAQKGIDNVKITYVLTQSEDNTEEILKELQANYSVVSKQEFSHSLTRENAIFNSTADYAFLLAQDVNIVDDETLAKLLHFTVENELAGAYLRQVSTERLDKYFREYSYPPESHIYCDVDLEQLGQKAVFFSDVFSCLNIETFKAVNGYDNKDLGTNEDMYYCYKCLSLGYKMGYFGDTFVEHSHKMTYKKTYERYLLIGEFFRHNKQISSLKNNKKDYLKIVFLILKKFDILALFMLIPNVIARVRGLRKGKKDISYETTKGKI